MNTNHLKNNVVTVNAEINDVLTPKTCAHIIIEIIKFLAYQKLQIPYAYDVLKYLVQKKRESDKCNPKINGSWQSTNYFRIASSAVDGLDLLFKNVVTEMESESPPDEVIVLLGAIPMCPKEAYSIRIPPALHSHYFLNHKDNSQKLVMKTLRQISFSEDFLKTVHHPLASTNMFVLLKRNASRVAESSTATHDFFVPTSSYQISPKIPQAEIRLNYNCNMSENCCRDIQIFSESCEANRSNPAPSKSDKNNSYGEVNIVRCDQWFLANVSLKGFKDCCINGQSVSDLWLNS